MCVCDGNYRMIRLAIFKTLCLLSINVCFFSSKCYEFLSTQSIYILIFLAIDVTKCPLFHFFVSFLSFFSQFILQISLFSKSVPFCLFILSVCLSICRFVHLSVCPFIGLSDLLLASATLHCNHLR